ncbi:MAG: hypothetical protein HQ461_02505 [Deltaproteobacteria bacterium]|nr:hypothetical protein [Deltaproteobacteria bacterium]
MRFESPQEAVDFALFRGRYEAARQSAAALSRDAAAVASYRGISPIPGARRIQIVSTGNLRGTLEDCGCKNSPLGGLARQATIGVQPVEGDAVALMLRLDAGDALFASREPATAVGETAEQVMARAMLAAYRALGMQAVAIGAYDLRLGAAWTLREAERAGVPMLSCNLRRGEGWAPGSVLLGEGANRVGVIGVTLATPETAAFLAGAGVEAGAAVTRYRAEAEALTARGAAGIVLLAAGGMEATRRFVEAVRDSGGPLPALALVSGSLQLTGDAIWAGEVPLLEAGDEGKTLLRTDLFVTGERIGLVPEGGGLLEGLRSYMTLLRSINNGALGAAGERLAAPQRGELERGLGERRRAAEAMARELARAAAAARAEGDARAARGALRNRIVPISPNTAEAPGVKRLVDEAKVKAERLTRGRAGAKNGRAR